MDQTRLALAETFAKVARALLGEEDVEATLKKITTLAVETIDGCDHAGVSLMQGRKISTPAASDAVPSQVDALQYETDQGPCLDAIREHETFEIDDWRKRIDGPSSPTEQLRRPGSPRCCRFASS